MNEMHKLRFLNSRNYGRVCVCVGGGGGQQVLTKGTIEGFVDVKPDHITACPTIYKSGHALLKEQVEQQRTQKNATLY